MIPRPSWLDRVVTNLEAAPADFFTRGRPVLERPRHSAVLVLVGPDPQEPAEQAVVLTERAGTLRSHAGQISFPGGRVDGSDAGPQEAALREAREEIGLDPSQVEVVATLPEIPVSPSNSLVTPVLAWWHTPGAIQVNSADEVAAVVCVPIADLAAAHNRFSVTRPGGARGVAFEVGDLFIWGFTAGLLDRLLDLAGLERPWDASVLREVPDRVRGRKMAGPPSPPLVDGEAGR